MHGGDRLCGLGLGAPGPLSTPVGRRPLAGAMWGERRGVAGKYISWSHPCGRTPHPPLILPSQAATSEKQMQGLHATGGWVWASQVFINPAQVGLAGPLGGSARP